MVWAGADVLMHGLASARGEVELPTFGIHVGIDPVSVPPVGPERNSYQGYLLHDASRCCTENRLASRRSVSDDDPLRASGRAH